MATVLVSVISDLVTDQRVHKVSQTLHEMGFEVVLVGTKKRNSLPLMKRAYTTRRITMLFQKGFLFYAEWNTRLLFYLLFKKSAILLVNDLDTLPPNYIISKLKRNVLVYDTHEYFTETAELYNRPAVKKIWQWIEKAFMPGVKYMYTVNNTIAGLYKEKYNKELTVVRNLPLQWSSKENSTPPVDFNFPTGKKILLLQGSGLNENRGLEELILSTPLLPADFIIVIAGSGLLLEQLQQMVAENQWQEKVFFTGILPMEALHQLTVKAFCGFSLDKPLNINQQSSLPNKLFDYIAAGIPVIASNIKEVAALVKQYELGIVLDEVRPENIAAAVIKLAKDETQYDRYKQNAVTATHDLNWDREKKIIETLFTKIITENNITIG